MSISEHPPDREARAAKNQTMFRKLNERLEESSEASGLAMLPGQWMCECVNDTCVERIAMSVEEYEAVRKSGAHFVVASSDEHFWPDVERVLEHNDRYWVVEKTGHAAVPAKHDDPPSDEEPLSLHT
jgi:hypothetical protein